MKGEGRGPAAAKQASAVSSLIKVICKTEATWRFREARAAYRE